MRKVLLITMLLVMLLPLIAQSDIPRPNFSPYANNGSSFLGLNKLSMSHSLGFQAGTSSTGEGYYLSLYTNHLKYKFNPKLEMNLDLNFVNYGGFDTGSKFELDNANYSRVIPEFSLRYTPRDNIQIQLQMISGSILNPYKNNYLQNW
ncbi:MAG: hypothetical protein WBJ09_05875 [Candidatus Cloacimonas acidaminovorans]